MHLARAHIVDDGLPNLGGHPKPAIEGHLKTGHSDTSKVDLDAGQKTPGVVAALTPDASCNRASPKVTGHIREIVREQVTSLETTEAGKYHQVFGDPVGRSNRSA